MGQIVNVTRNAETLQGYQIQSPEDMMAVLQWGKPNGYSGHINLDAAGNYTMGLTSPNGDTAQSAVINDWAVLKNGVQCTLVPAAQAGSLYTVVTP